MIVRTPHRAKFTIVLKATLEDSSLSWKARGLLAYLLSKPDSWQVYVSELVRGAPTGRTAVLTGLKELEACGYLVRSRRRQNAGRFSGTEVLVFECPTVGKPYSGPNRENDATSQVGANIGKPDTSKD